MVNKQSIPIETSFTKLDLINYIRAYLGCFVMTLYMMWEFNLIW